MHEMLGAIRPGWWMLLLRGENICGEVLQVWRTNRVEVVTMLI